MVVIEDIKEEPSVEQQVKAYALKELETNNDIPIKKLDILQNIINLMESLTPAQLHSLSDYSRNLAIAKAAKEKLLESGV